MNDTISSVTVRENFQNGDTHRRFILKRRWGVCIILWREIGYTSELYTRVNRLKGKVNYRGVGGNLRSNDPTYNRVSVPSSYCLAGCIYFIWAASIVSLSWDSTVMNKRYK
jgi:hypothetical protein